MRADRAENGIDEREPEHVAVDDELMTAERHRECTRKIPEHDAECAERRQLLEEAQQQLERQRDELIDVLADTLIRVVRVAAEHLQAVVDLMLHPACEIPVRHPRPPADLEHLPQVDCIDRNDDVEERERCELADERPEALLRILLQCIVKLIVPAVDAHEQIHRREIQPDDECQEPPRPPFMLRVPVPAEQVPEGTERTLLHGKTHPLISKCNEFPPL